MKQKILYIILMITALVGGKGNVWGQSDVPGYNRTTSSSITYSQSGDGLNSINNNNFVLSTPNTLSNTTDNVNFSIVDISFNKSRKSLYIYGNQTKTLTWNANYFYVTLNEFEIKSRCTIGGQGGNGKIKIAGGGKEASHKVYTLSTSNYKTLSISDFTIGPDNNITITTYDDWGAEHFINSLKFTYKISKYELIINVLDEAISYANSKSSSIDESIRSYLTTAIDSANNFMGKCAFPNSYWNGSPKGKTPADVTEEAAKLKAIADYLVARTNASVYNEDEIPNEVYRQLHQYDQYDPNNFDSNTINNAKTDIERAIGYAQKTNEPYISAKSAIATAAARTDHNDAAALEADVTKATNELEAATTVDAINAALTNIKNFDNITFNGPFSVDEGVTIDNPANATSGKGVAYSSSDETIVSISGTTLKALKPGTVTITASTSTSEVYYGYTETKEYTIKAKPLVLEPTEKCSVNLDVEYPTVTLNRTFTIGHSTLALPFDTDISDLSESPEAYAAQLSLVTYNQADGYTLYFKIVEGGAMVANQPYVIYLPSTKNSFSWSNVTINSVTPLAKAEGENERFQGWTMQANYTPGFPMVGNYGIVGGKFCLGIGVSKINAYTAYFIPPTTQTVRTRVAILDEWGNATFIGEVEDGVLQTEEGIFGLDGVRQNELRRGINIVKTKDGTVRKVLK